MSQLIVLQCDADFNCVPHNVARALLEGVTLGFDARFGDDDDRGVARPAAIPRTS